MNFKELGIQAIRPLAILKGGLNGTRFIAEATNKSGEAQLLSLTPPDYDPAKAVPIKPYILESAIEKHSFIPVKHDSIVTFEDYEKYLQEINQPPEKE